MYHIDDSLTYPYDTAVYVVLTTEEFALDTNIHLGRTGTALRSLEFADNSRYVYFTRSNIRGGMIGYAIADSTYMNDSLTNTGGNIRRGEDGVMYAGLRNGMRTISDASSLTPTIDFEDFGIASVNYNMFGSGSSPQLLKTGPISVVQKGIYTRTLNQKYYELADIKINNIADVNRISTGSSLKVK